MDGVRLARKVGTGMGPFAYVVASPIPRTAETAIAMGFAVDEVWDFAGGEVWEAAASEISHRDLRHDEHLYRIYVSAAERGGMVAALGQRQVHFWSEAAEKIAEGEAALVLTHGGLIEPGLVAALPDWPHERWGRGFRHCEGARLTWSEGRFVDREVLHLPHAPRY